MQRGSRFAVWTILAGLGTAAAAEPAEKAAVKAAEPAPLLHDKRINGQTVKIEVGQRLEVRVSGGCSWHLAAVGGDSAESDGKARDAEQGRGYVFGFRGRRPGRTRAVLVMYGPGGKADTVDFNVDVTGPGKASDPADVPLFLFDGAYGETYTVPVGRKIEFALRSRDEGGSWKVGEPAGKSVRHDADPKAKDAAGVLKFAAVKPGRTVVALDWVDTRDNSRKVAFEVTLDVTPAAKGITPDTF
jgi:hypothetical protein